jgi:monothiol glutaredoxin
MDQTEDQMLVTIKDAIEKHKIAVFMKGTPAQPRCGFSATVVDILNKMNVPYVGVDAIADPRFRHVLSAHSGWPTLPQVFVGGKLIGGCDIVREMKATGELDKVVAEAVK